MMRTFVTLRPLPDGKRELRVDVYRGDREELVLRRGQTLNDPAGAQVGVRWEMEPGEVGVSRVRMIEVYLDPDGGVTVNTDCLELP